MFKSKKMKELEKQLLAAQKENARLNGQVEFYKNSVEINKNLNEMQKLNHAMYKENQAIKSKIDGITIKILDENNVQAFINQDLKEQSVRHATQNDFENF